MTYDDAVGRIRLYCGNRSDVTPTLAGQMMNERMKMLCVPFKFSNHEAEYAAVTIAGTNSVAMPAAAYAIERIWDMDNDRELDYIEHEDYLYRNRNDYEGPPRKFTVYGNQVLLFPIPDLEYDLTFYGFGLPTDISGSTELPIPEDWHPMVCKYTAADILFLKGNHERALTLKNEALGDLSTRQEPRTFLRRQQQGQISVDRSYMNYRGHSPRRRSQVEDYNGW